MFLVPQGGDREVSAARFDRKYKTLSLGFATQIPLCFVGKHLQKLIQHEGELGCIIQAC